MRCFIAIEIPQNVKTEISSIQKQLKKVNSEHKIKWMENHNMHLTLQFIGDIDPNKAEELKQSLENIKFRPFTIGFDNKLSFFPNKFNPKIVKISIPDKKEYLKKLNSKIREQLNKSGIKYDKKPFSAHITLGRIKYLNSKFNDNIFINIPDFSVSKFILFCSELIADGPIYTQLAKYNL